MSSLIFLEYLTCLSLSSLVSFSEFHSIFSSLGFDSFILTSVMFLSFLSFLYSFLPVVLPFHSWDFECLLCFLPSKSWWLHVYVFKFMVKQWFHVFLDNIFRECCLLIVLLLFPAFFFFFGIVSLFGSCVPASSLLFTAERRQHRYLLVVHMGDGELKGLCFMTTSSFSTATESGSHR